MIHEVVADWDAASPAEREACARTLQPRLPGRLAYAGLSRCALGAQTCEVALYEEHADTQAEVPPRRFALVPGSDVCLGFDADGWQPSPAMQAEWADSATEWDLPPLPNYLARVLAPPRTVRLPPMLVEADAWEVGWSPVTCDDPEVRALAAAHPGAGQVTVGYGDGALRVTRRQDGALRAERADDTDQADLLARLAREGWSLPGADAWEHLCGGGARTLFRWGDEAPCDAYPTDRTPGFDLHRRPNALGITIAADPYQREVTATAGVTRGGDGGVAICGGAGFLLGWLPLATAWCDPDFCEHPPAEIVVPGHTLARRVRVLE